jgi:mycothiol synthase
MKYSVVRNIGPELLVGITRLIDAARAHDDHNPLGEHKWLDLMAGHDGFVGIVAHDDDGAPVGYAHLSRHASGWGLEVVVHPDHRNAGLEESLVRRALDVVASQGGGHVNFWVFQPDDVHDELARRLGLVRGRDLLHVCVGLPVEKTAELPPGIRLRSFEPGRDEAAWLDVNNRAFAEHPEQGAWDAETLHRRMIEPWFDPDDFLLATDDAGIAGFNWTKLHPDRGTGEIYVIGVDPDRKSAGVGKTLLLAGLQHMAEKGMQRACLYVDEANEPALTMYQKIGFEVDHLDRAYATDVPAR